MLKDRKTLKDWALRILIGIIIFGAGFYSKCLIDQHTIIKFSDTINWEANPLELLSLIVTILLAIYVTRTLGKRNESEKVETELLINYILGFKKDLLERFDSISTERNIEQVKLNSDCKIIRKRLHSIISLAVENGYVDRNDNLVNSLKDEVTNIWETLTDTPPLIDGSASKEVTDGIATLRADKISKVENIIIEIEKIVFNLILKINKG